MILFCPRCGVEFPHKFRGEWFDTDRPCPECGVVVGDPPGMLVPSDAEVTYGLDEWPVADRATLVDALVADNIPYRWEDGVVLAVPEAVEATVDAILDDLEAAAGGSPDGGVEPGAIPDGDDLEADGGEEAQSAMADLFVVADRLQHSPSDPALAVELDALVDSVAASLPPYGLDRATWAHVHRLATTVIESDGEDATAEAATALRDFLRPYV